MNIDNEICEVCNKPPCQLVACQRKDCPYKIFETPPSEIANLFDIYDEDEPKI